MDVQAKDAFVLIPEDPSGGLGDVGAPGGATSNAGLNAAIITLHVSALPSEAVPTAGPRADCTPSSTASLDVMGVGTLMRSVYPEPAVTVAGFAVIIPAINKSPLVVV